MYIDFEYYVNCRVRNEQKGDLCSKEHNLSSSENNTPPKKNQACTRYQDCDTGTVLNVMYIVNQSEVFICHWVIKL